MRVEGRPKLSIDKEGKLRVRGGYFAEIDEAAYIRHPDGSWSSPIYDWAIAEANRLLAAPDPTGTERCPGAMHTGGIPALLFCTLQAGHQGKCDYAAPGRAAHTDPTGTPRLCPAGCGARYHGNGPCPEPVAPPFNPDPNLAGYLFTNEKPTGTEEANHERHQL